MASARFAHGDIFDRALLDELAPSGEGSYTRLISFVKDRPGHDRRYAIDARKIERELGWGVFDNAANNALKDMDFIPGQIGLAPVKSRMIIKIEFKVGTDLQ